MSKIQSNFEASQNFRGHGRRCNSPFRVTLVDRRKTATSDPTDDQGDKVNLLERSSDRSSVNAEIKLKAIE